MKRKFYASICVVLFSLLTGSINISQGQSEGGPAFTCIPAENYVCRGCHVFEASHGYRQGSYPNCW